MDAGDLAVHVTGDTKALVSDIEQSGETAGAGWGKKFMGAVAALGIGVAVGSFLKGSVEAAEEAAAGIARLDTTLRNAGDSTGAWSQHQQELASSLSMTAGVADDTIMAGQAILATFHTLASSAGETGGMFDRATAAAVDLSAAGFGSVESASTMLGKALEDPAKGITALTRVGVTFTDAQKEQIEAMMEAGDVAGAQGVIMAAVENQVGGVAAATATASDKMKVAWGETQEAVGTVLLPVIEKLSDFVVGTLLPAFGSVVDWISGTAIPAFQNLGRFIMDNKTPILVVVGIITTALLPALVTLGVQATISAAKAVAGWVAQAAGAVANGVIILANLTAIGLAYIKQGAQAMAGAAKAVLSWVIQKAPMAVTLALYVATFAVMVAGWVASAAASMASAAVMAAAWLIALGPVAWIIAAIVAIVGVFVLLWTKCEWFRDFWIAVWDTIVAVVLAVVDWIVGAAKAIWEAIQSAFQSVLDFVRAVWDWIVEKVVWVFETYKSIITAIWEFIRDAFQKALDFVRQVWDWLVEKVVQVYTFYKEKIEAIWQFIKDTFQKVKDFVTGIWQAVVDFFRQRVENIIANVQWIWDKVQEVFQKVKDFISKVIDTVVGFFTGLKDKVVGALSGAVDWLVNAGKDMINGLLNGAKEIMNGIKDWVKKNIFDKIVNSVKSLFGISSPSKVMAALGENVSAGMAEGIASGKPDVDAELASLVPRQRMAVGYSVNGGSLAAPEVHVYIGDTELKGIVKTEVRRAGVETAQTLLAGVRI